MKFDLNLTITGIIALVALCSPIIVTVLNNKHDYKIRKLEFNNKVKQEVLSKFALTVTKAFQNQFINDDFRQSLNMLYLYFDVDDQLVNKILTCNHQNIHEFQKDVTTFMKSLSKQIKSK